MLLNVLLFATSAVQMPADLAAERAEFAHWLRTAPISPYAAVYHQVLDDRLVLGDAAYPLLAGAPGAELVQERQLTLRIGDRTRPVPRNRAVAIEDWHLRVNGARGEATVTVFGPFEPVEPPGWYDWDRRLVVTGLLEPPDEHEARRMLGLDGIAVDASLAGTFVATVAGRDVRLLVYRMPVPGTEESDLMIFFRDSTNSMGTYPAGRFVALFPLGQNRHRADFNRARNPFCAYNTVFPCPLPWRGNMIDAAITAGERYSRASEITR